MESERSVHRPAGRYSVFPLTLTPRTRISESRAMGKSGETFVYRLIIPIFFASGFAALIYQITWQRALFTIFGINVEAVTVVVTGFLLGLGFGSLIGGWLSRRRPGNLLALFGAIELAIGVFGAMSLYVFQWVGARTLTLPAPLTITATVALVVMPTLL